MFAIVFLVQSCPNILHKRSLFFGRVFFARVKNCQRVSLTKISRVVCRQDREGMKFKKNNNGVGGGNKQWLLSISINVPSLDKKDSDSEGAV